MFFPRALFATSAARRDNSTTNSPLVYCSPQCPGCQEELVAFDVTTACMPNSDFIVECGACQECIITFATENDTTPDTSMNLSPILEACLNTTSGDQIQMLEAQASRISALADEDDSTTAAGAATSIAAATSSIAPSTTTMTYAISTAPAPAPATATQTSTTLVPTTTPLSSQNLPPSWIAGPILGSILGMAIVFLVILFKRRKHARNPPPTISPSLVPPPLPSRPLSKLDRDLADNESENDFVVLPENAQLHGECILRGELDGKETEVVLPAELPAIEPVGSELSSPRDESVDPSCRLVPVSPSSPPASKVAMMDRRGLEEGQEGVGWKRHETFYHP